MNSGATNSGERSERTSGSGRTNPKNKPGGESQFLIEQAEQAKAAIAAVASELGRDLGKTIDPRMWAAAHPWATLAVAAAGGFAAASMLVPSKEEQALNRLKRIEKALRPQNAEPVDEDAKPQRKEGGGVISTVLIHLLNALQPVLMSAVTGAVTAAAARPTAEELRAAGQGAAEGCGGQAEA